LEATTKLGDRRELAAAINALAQLHRAQNDLEKAEPLYERFMSLVQSLEDAESIAIGLLNFAIVAIQRGAGEKAREMLLRVLAITEETGSKPAGQSLLEVTAGLAELCQEWPACARFYGAAEAQTLRTGLRRDPADEAFLAPLIEKSRTAVGAAAFEAAENAGRALSYEEAIAEARDWLNNTSRS
jgi:tetratricopeptide (TPR) repeat protein